MARFTLTLQPLGLVARVTVRNAAGESTDQAGESPLVVQRQRCARATRNWLDRMLRVTAQTISGEASIETEILNPCGPDKSYGFTGAAWAVIFPCVSTILRAR